MHEEGGVKEQGMRRKMKGRDVRQGERERLKEIETYKLNVRSISAALTHFLSFTFIIPLSLGW